ncbi:hypothetical protein KR044_004246 [Drosophila immigrans]|nr:hypothetical protein KR044_004246 [Drosophila immigrans]
MNTKHSEPFYISSNLFDNRRLKRRLCKWMERLRERQQLYMAQMRSHSHIHPHTHTHTHMHTHTPASKTERGSRQRRCQLMLSRRHVAATLPADITIDLLSDEEDEEPPVAAAAALQLSTVPNITLVPVDLKRATCTTTSGATFTDSIVLTSDDEDNRNEFSRRHLMRSPPPLAPLTFSSDAIEEVTVSLVPRNSTIASCQARQRRRQPRLSPTIASPSSCDGYLRVDVASDVAATLPDETTVHTVIANRIYELSLSKLREGLASSGVPEYAHDLLPEQLQKLSPAMRAKVAPMVLATPPAPISLKLSSDLSISLISDDDDCESSGNNGSGGDGNSELLHPVVAEAHAAAKLLKQQQPQLSVVQHLQYPGHGTPVALPVMALAATSPPTLLQSTRRRKLG